MLVPLGLILLAVAVYSGVGGFGFVNWDDPNYITANATVQSGLSAGTAWWAFTAANDPYWHPITWLTHLADVSLFGLDAGAHHLVNASWHAANSAFLFAALFRLTRRRAASIVVAALFAVHPLHVESVAWIAERKDVLSGFFWIATLWAWARYSERETPARYAIVAGAFVLAVMAKPMAVTLPAVLVITDWWLLGRMPRWRAIAPLAVISAGVAAATAAAQSGIGAMAPLWVLGVGARLSNALVSVVRYLAAFAWPAHLSPFYRWIEWPAPVVAGAAALIAGVTVVAWRQRAARPYVTWGWAYLVITLAPVIGLLQAGEQAMADRFMYLPMIGPLVAVVWAIDDALASPARRAWRRPAAAVAGIAVVVLGAVAHAQASVWRDSETLWRHALTLDPANYTAHQKLGVALRDAGRPREARESLLRARATLPPADPALAGIIDNLIGLTWMDEGRPDAAREAFAAASREFPDLAEARANYGNALAAVGEFAAAETEFAAASALQPDATAPLVGRGHVLVALGRTADAVAAFRAALGLEPELAEAHGGLGAALLGSGDAAGAEAELRRAIALKPTLSAAHFNLALLLARSGRIDEARAEAERALEADPNAAQARQLLAALAR